MSGFAPIDRARTASERYLVGLMSGMSMDGLDIAVIRVTERNGRPGRPDVELVAGDTYAYDDDLRARIRAAVSGSVAEEARLSTELATLWGRHVNEVDRKSVV